MAATPKAEVLLSAGHNVVLVLDYGSQYTQLIARRVREIGLLSILLPGDVTMVSARRAIAGAPLGAKPCRRAALAAAAKWVMPSMLGGSPTAAQLGPFAPAAAEP